MQWQQQSSFTKCLACTATSYQGGSKGAWHALLAGTTLAKGRSLISQNLPATSNSKLPMDPCWSWT
eukprot:scaffold236357_cov14-Tisochrysis_lutea.AAC.2